MKKIFAILLILSLAAIAFGCEKQNTLKFEDTFVTTDENVIEAAGDPDMNWADFFGDVSPESMYKEAEVVVYGTVGKVEFYDNLVFGYTLYEFTIEKAYKGDIKEGEKITVGTTGGDVRMEKDVKKHGNSFGLSEEEIANTVLRYRQYDEAIPKEGEKFMLYLTKYVRHEEMKEEDSPPEGIYAQDKVCAGRYFYGESGELERAVPSRYQTIYMPKDEKGEFVEETKENDDKWTFEELDKKLSELKAK